MKKAMKFLDDIVKNISCSAQMPARLSRNAKLRLVAKIESLHAENDYIYGYRTKAWSFMSTTALSCDALVSLCLVCPHFEHNSTDAKAPFVW